MMIVPHLSRSRSVSARTMLSIAPPAGYGTTIRTGFDGNVCAAATLTAKNRQAAAQSERVQFITTSDLHEFPGRCNVAASGCTVHQSRNESAFEHREH